MPYPRITIFVGLIFYFLAPRIASAQLLPLVQAQKNTLKDDPAGYKSRSDDNRYEGLYSKHVNNVSFEVLSFTKGKISFSFSDAALYFKPAVTGPITVKVAGQSFGLPRNYRLDFIMQASRFFRVPIAAVISERDIFAPNLGVFGYIGVADSPTAFLPMVVGVRPGATTGSDIRLVVRSSHQFSQLTIKYVHVINKRATQTFHTQTIIGPFLAQEAFVIPLNYSEKVAPGLTHLKIEAQVDGKPDETELYNLDVYLPAN